MLGKRNGEQSNNINEANFFLNVAYLFYLVTTFENQNLCG